MLPTVGGLGTDGDDEVELQEDCLVPRSTVADYMQVTLHGMVYRIPMSFVVNDHPGGAYAMLQYHNCDISNFFGGHSESAHRRLEMWCLGPAESVKDGSGTGRAGGSGAVEEGAAGDVWGSSSRSHHPHDDGSQSNRSGGGARRRGGGSGSRSSKSSHYFSFVAWLHDRNGSKGSAGSNNGRGGGGGGGEGGGDTASQVIHRQAIDLNTGLASAASAAALAADCVQTQPYMDAGALLNWRDHRDALNGYTESSNPNITFLYNEDEAEDHFVNHSASSIPPVYVWGLIALGSAVALSSWWRRRRAAQTG